ncbi:hypothetical protein XENORESO_004046, partial [Xenotaenia resolanae]
MMLPRRQDYGKRTSDGLRSGPVTSFRSAGSPSSVHRGSAVLPSVLTFLVVVASGGLLLMIEKGMLNSMETPSPRGNARRLELFRESRTHGSDGVDVDSE